MEFVIVMPDKIKIPITREEKQSLEKAINDNLPVFKIQRNEALIPLRPVPAVLPSGYYEKPRPNPGYSGGQYLPTVDELMRIGPGNPKKQLVYEKARTKLLSEKSIPALSYDEQLRARAEGGERRAQNMIRGED